MNRNSTHFGNNPVNLDISRSMFSRDHGVKFSFNVGDVIPFFVDDVLPGDTVTIDTSKVVRLQPLVTPIMDEVFLDTYYFFVPNRLIWNHWINFMGENTSSPWTPDVEYSVPQLTIPQGGFDVGTIADYMGVPVKRGAGTKISALPFRAYALIMDQWFRSENLMTPVNVPTDDTNVTGVNTGDQVTDIVKGGKPFIACKTFDYFTGALPEPQKGPDVTLGFNQIAPVSAFSNMNLNPDMAVGSSFKDKYASHINFRTLTASGDVANLSYYSGSNLNLGVSASGTLDVASGTPSLVNRAVFPVNLGVDLSNTLFSVNQLRQAFAVQKYYEKLARGGSRYIELIKAFFGVTSPDSRLQRTEYLGGNRIYLDVNQVAQTSATEESLSPQGNVVGLSVTGDVNSDFTKSFTEHGILMGVCVARYNHTYQQGLERFWSRKNLFDFYNPTFANLGEQPIRRKEIYLSDNVVDNDAVFGYQEAWADYRYKPNRIAGEMRSDYEMPLDSWHLGDNYTSAPRLSPDWIREDKTMLDRCLAVTSQVSNQLIADFWIKADYARPMPLYSIPGLIDHN